MNLFFTQICRRFALSALLVILLAAVISFQAIAFSALDAVQTQISAVGGQYTTAAVPKETALWWRIFTSEDGNEIISPMLQRDQYPGLLSEDRRGILNAHVTGCESVSAYEKDTFSNDAYDIFSRSFAVLAVRCTRVSEYDFTGNKVIFDENNAPVGSEEFRQQDYVAAFAPESIVRMFPAYYKLLPPMEEIHGSFPYLSDGTLPFEEGKTYLLFCCIFPSQKILTFDENGEVIYEYTTPNEYHLKVYDHTISTTESRGNWGSAQRGEFSDLLRSWKYKIGDDGVYRDYMDKDVLPFCAEYEGSVEDFLRSEAGTLWRDTILPFCQTNYESANVILTNDINSILWFNTGDAAIIEGRSFEAPKYANGEDVCLVSAAYAMKNGLSVGDSIEMDFYKSTIGTMSLSAKSSFSESQLCNVFEPCKEENRLNIKKNYTIVGVYSAPEFSISKHAFSANTIFIPKSSIPNASRYEDAWHSLLYSLILENGKADEFEAALEARDCGGLFAYYDQDYNVLAETLDVMRGNALRMLWIGSALFVLVAALFLLLFFRQTADPAKKLRLLGVSAKRVRRQRYLAAVLLIALASVLGAAGGAGLYGAVSTRILSSYVAMRPAALLVSTAAQAFLLLLAALVCTLATANQNLMQCRKQE